MQVALQLIGEENEAARAALARDAELAEAFAIAARPAPKSVAAPVIALAAALMVGVAVLPSEREASTLVPKGAVEDRVSLAVERGATRFELPIGGALHPGDRFGLFYSSPASGHLTVLHCAPSGASVLYSGPISQASRTPLPRGGTVTDLSGDESLVAIFSASPVEPSCDANVLGARARQVIPISR